MSIQTGNSTNKALKEWASVIEAVGQGKQLILFRKGGIIERFDEFEVESPEFFLYPTYVHQTPEQLQTRYQGWIQETEAQKPSPNQVHLTHYAKVEKVLRATGIEGLSTLTDEIIWNPEYLATNWAWKPEKPAYVLFLRVYQLATPILLDERPEYGGCVSWVDLADAYPVENLTPVMSDEEFDARITKMIDALQQTIVPV